MRDQYKGAFFSYCFLSWPFLHIKKFFICGKTKDWLINHTQQKYNNSKKKLEDWYPKYNVWLGYKKTLQYWIIKYESIDNNKDIAQYFENLSIDILNNYTPKSESFYIKSK